MSGIEDMGSISYFEVIAASTPEKCLDCRVPVEQAVVLSSLVSMGQTSLENAIGRQRWIGKECGGFVTGKECELVGQVPPFPPESPVNLPRGRRRHVA